MKFLTVGMGVLAGMFVSQALGKNEQFAGIVQSVPQGELIVPAAVTAASVIIVDRLI